MTEQQIPEGFEKLLSESPFNNLVGPYYTKLIGNRISIGLRLGKQHCNRSGRLHGAMVCALFDSTMGNNIGLDVARTKDIDQSMYNRSPATAPMATVSLTTNFLGSAKLGDWVEATADVRRPGKSLAFVDAELRRDGDVIANASGVFRVFAQAVDATG